MTRVLRRGGAGPFVIFCDHASNHVPAELENLGLPEAELRRHIAWDIGAAGVTEYLSEAFDSAAILCGTSRLVIDCNRQLTAADLVPEMSDGTPIPGNVGIGAAGRAARVARYFQPYHDSVEAVFAERAGQIALSVHSMTDCMAGVARPWEISLSSYRDRSLTEPLLAALREPGDVVVGDNEPYDLDPAVDFSTPFHALRRGLPHIQVEFRQDRIANRAGQLVYAERFAVALRKVLQSVG